MSVEWLDLDGQVLYAYNFYILPESRNAQLYHLPAFL